MSPSSKATSRRSVGSSGPLMSSNWPQEEMTTSWWCGVCTATKPLPSSQSTRQLSRPLAGPLIKTACWLQGVGLPIGASAFGTLPLCSRLTTKTQDPRFATWCFRRMWMRLWARTASLRTKSFSGSTPRCKRWQRWLVTPTECCIWACLQMGKT